MPSPLLYMLIAAIGLSVVGSIHQDWKEWPVEWERLLVVVIEALVVLYALERVDGWVKLLVDGGAK